MEQLIYLPVLILAVVVHECAHGLVAKWCGDDTAYREGRITLNPISHVDLWGTIIVPLVLALSSAGLMFGWAKPVPVNPNNFRHFRRDDILVSMAGPASNFIIAFISALFIVLLSLVWKAASPESASSMQFGEFALELFKHSIQINLYLALLNLIPIPPLDGSHVIANLLPPHLGEQYRSLGFIGIFILIVMISIGVINAAIDPFIEYLIGLLNAFIVMLAS
ncbi:MAG TPA: site-2 protease family protein [bacterium]|nr:site-2 protease family protein [bacterium]HMW35121.1 site-2 protease family protein [bacterium]HMY36471.1 site-2 protease family protein [bacterium]HMZ03975.1 site-2 protease family protein [bacterium]HNB09240.1 site-2 protease family protein [bacterium]